MMPDTLTAQLIADVWTSLDEAVTNGLAEEAKNGLSRQVLANVVVVSDEKDQFGGKVGHVQNRGYRERDGPDPGERPGQ